MISAQRPGRARNDREHQGISMNVLLHNVNYIIVFHIKVGGRLDAGDRGVGESKRIKSQRCGGLLLPNSG